VQRPWVLVLERSHGEALRPVGGLSVPLRLALDAQRAGAAAVVCGAEAGIRPGQLADARLRIPVFDARPPDAVAVKVPASYVLHRDVFRILAERGEDVTLDVARAPRVEAPYAFAPVDVVDRASARRAERALFRSLRKPQDGWTSRWLNRYVSLAISRWLVRTPLRPNQVSVAILGVGIAGAVLAAQGTYGSLVAGAALFQSQSILDGCDGEMSRVTYRGSHLGEWLDTIGDDVTNYGFFAGAAIGLHAMTGSAVYLAAGAVTVGAGVLTSLIEYRYLLKIGSGDLLKYPTSRAASEGTSVLSRLMPLFKRDTFVFLTLLAAIAGLAGPMLVVFAAAAVGILGNVLAAEARMAREGASGA
jgi:phosphatidylglycerophosphate synthase